MQLLKEFKNVSKKTKIGIPALVSPDYGGMYQYTQYLINILLKYSRKFEYVIVRNNKFDIVEGNIENISKIKNISEPSWFSKFLIFTKFIVKEYMVFGDIGRDGNNKVVALWINPTVISISTCYIDKPYIIFLYDFCHKYYPSSVGIKERIFINLTYNRLAKNSTLIICGTKFVKKDIVRFLKVNENKVYILSPPLPMPSEKETILTLTRMEEIKNIYQLPKKFIFYPAHFWPHKNHARLIEAVSLIRDKYGEKINLILVGLKKNNFNNIVKKINELHLGEQVKWLGYVSKVDKICLYKLSTAVVMPSFCEAGSLVTWEALYFGTPLLYSDIFGWSEELGGAGLPFNPLNVEDIGEKIFKIWVDVKLRSELVAKGYEKIKENNPEDFSRQLEGIIERALERRLS